MFRISFIHNHQNLETTQIPVSRMDKQLVIYLHKGILHGNKIKKKKATATYNNMQIDIVE